ncbi:MAG TPA: GMC family oxidoreductase N-terminal domain-containing protein [Mycobacteriales bacterium]|nr:GMC family oxidoreductase N-terminal domain-containing protein [Mycobacteriales bacterium]
MAEQVDVCVIGSGFGGSILAYYLAHAGQKVLVLERGERRADDSLQVEIDAKELTKITHQFLGDGIVVLVGSVVGGGSLVYSGVSLRAPSFVFERQASGRRIWPTALTRRGLDPYYARAEQGLGVHQLSFSEVGRRGGTWALHMNRLGYRVDPIRQATTRCLHCGFCNTGCKFSRKNVVTMNYLRGAEHAGAEVRPDSEAIQVMPADGGYRVLYGPPDRASIFQPAAPNLVHAREVQAKRVVLAGGAMGTGGLLVRSRPWLPALSAQAGNNLSANGDLALMARLPADPSLPGRGLSMQQRGVAMDTVCYEFLKSHGFVIITQHELSPATIVNGDPDELWWGLRKKHLMRSYGSELVGLAVIGVDGSPGRILGNPSSSDEIKATAAFGVSGIQFPIDRETRQLWDGARRIVSGLVDRMGGEMVDLVLNASPDYDESAYTAHPVGTARLADSPAIGVANADGEVFGYPGLFVADGAAVPTALGVNPSLTIAAIAERIASRLVRRLGHDPVDPPIANPHHEPWSAHDLPTSHTWRRR